MQLPLQCSLLSKIVGTIALSSFGLITVAEAYELEHVPGYTDQSRRPHHRRPLTTQNDETPALRFEKFQRALKILGVPPEADPSFQDFPASGTISYSQVMDQSHWIDRGELHRYLDLNPQSVSLYKDFFPTNGSPALPTSYLEFNLPLTASNESNDSLSLIHHLHAIALHAQSDHDQPLRGLRIAIDPGHMGTPYWDEKTGKYVEPKDAHGNKIGGYVSEGELNLWTAFLTANQLEKLGATVMLSRTELRPVVAEHMEGFDLSPSIHQYFYNSMDEDWMAAILKKSDEEMERLLPHEHAVELLKEESEKNDLFNQADLNARSDLMNQFHPDITLDIHYDALDKNATQDKTNNTQVMIPGSFMADETGSRLSKALALKELLEVNRWNASRALAVSLVHAVADSVKLPLLDDAQVGDSFKVEDGVYARNLFICSHVRQGLMVYLEGFHYDHESEFKNLTINNKTGTYHGIEFHYPSRIEAVSAGITTGLLNYFK